MVSSRNRAGSKEGGLTSREEAGLTSRAWSSKLCNCLWLAVEETSGVLRLLVDSMVKVAAVDCNESLVPLTSHIYQGWAAAVVVGGANQVPSARCSTHL